jgi:hypothetical protein
LDQGQGLSEHTSPEVWYVNLSVYHQMRKERQGMGEEGERQGKEKKE